MTIKQNELLLFAAVSFSSIIITTHFYLFYYRVIKQDTQITNNNWYRLFAFEYYPINHFVWRVRHLYKSVQVCHSEKTVSPNENVSLTSHSSCSFISASFWAKRFYKRLTLLRMNKLISTQLTAKALYLDGIKESFRQHIIEI
jgi:hypothetical protein